MKLEDKVLAVILKYGEGRGGCDEWEIASSIYPWDDFSQRAKHGAWIRAIIQAGQRLQKNGLAGSYLVSHGLPGYNAPQSRIWFAKKKSNDPPAVREKWNRVKLGVDK